MRDALRDRQPEAVRRAPSAPAQVSKPEPAAERAGALGPTHLAQLFADGKFVVSVELDPPRGINPAKMLAGAALLKDAGVDVMNVADSPMARVRMSCLAAARLVQETTGVETIIHFTTRDRNLMALQSELVGAHATGIRNVLALTGDPPSLGDYPNATGVWDVDAIGLIAILKRLNEGRDYAGTSIGRRASFFVGCAVNPTASDVPKELDRFQRKLDAGADFVMSQPLYDMDTLECFLDRVGTIPIPMLLGIMPVQSYKHAEFLHNEVPGIVIPPGLLERMRRAGEAGIAEGIAQAQEFVAKAKPLVQGVYFMPSFGRYEMVSELVKAL
jgi:homocysteine S-methyltransferase